MCGILALLNRAVITARIGANFQKGRMRGPERSEINAYLSSVILGFHRLAINGITNESDMPLEREGVVLICNGEIYNYKSLYKSMKAAGTTANDCEVIITLYKKYGIESTLCLLDGVFAFVLLDLETKQLFAARDLFGVRPMFQMYDSQGMGFSSTLGMIVGFEPNQITPFQPGTYSEFSLTGGRWECIKTGQKYTNIVNSIDYTLASPMVDLFKRLRYSLQQAVYKRVQTTDRPIACLLSGGLDSSLVAALVNKFYEQPLETYSIGMEGAEDLKYSQIVADYLGTIHTQVILTEQEFLDAIPEVIRVIESYDVTTVRASVGNYLVGKYIKEHSEAKVIFNGDGSDEVTGGYLYFAYCPSSLDFDIECKRLLKDIHYFDVLRSDRCISSHGLEPRTPFLDKSFVQTYLSIPSGIRNHARKIKKGSTETYCEKYLLRNTFTVLPKPLLPKEILFRPKEAFSDGVSSLSRSWYIVIQEYLASRGTTEKAYYKSIFDKYYSKYDSVIPYYWLPKFIEETECSARALSVYTKPIII